MLMKKQPIQNQPSPASPGANSSNTPQRPPWLPGRVWLLFLMILMMNYVLGKFIAPDAE